MKTLEKDELFQNLQGFLKTKGLELKEGGYTQKLQQGCALLSEAINTGQEGLTRAKVGIDKKLEQLRQVIHEKTAPAKPSPSAPPPESPRAKASAPKSAKAKSNKRSKPRKRQ